MAREEEGLIEYEGDQVDGEIVSYTAVLLTQGKHRFFTLSMPSDVLAETCIVDYRSEDPEQGFQRNLDEKRAQDIADYIDRGFGTIPSSIILSAQPVAELRYIRRTRTLKFKNCKGAFLIIDGQHRVYGFRKAKSCLRVPVVIYNDLTRPQECRLFIDINTKQRPVPNELLLDIKRLAEAESDSEALMREVFDRFDKIDDSALLGLTSPAERKAGKLSRVTFNTALKQAMPSFQGEGADFVYDVINAYLHACMSGLRRHDASGNITNPTLFKALMLLFPVVAERVADRFQNEFNSKNFASVLDLMFVKIRKVELAKPGNSPSALFDSMRKAMTSGFTISSKTSD